MSGRRRGRARACRDLRVAMMVTALATVGFVGTAQPADAGNGDIYRDVFANTFCLEANCSGEVYAIQCVPPNGAADFQRRYQWFGGWIKNVETTTSRHDV
jgi:hypothetical protein